MHVPSQYRSLQTTSHQVYLLCKLAETDLCLGKTSLHTSVKPNINLDYLRAVLLSGKVTIRGV